MAEKDRENEILKSQIKELKNLIEWYSCDLQLRIEAL